MGNLFSVCRRDAQKVFQQDVFVDQQEIFSVHHQPNLKRNLAEASTFPTLQPKNVIISDFNQSIDPPKQKRIIPVTQKENSSSLTISNLHQELFFSESSTEVRRAKQQSDLFEIGPQSSSHQTSLENIIQHPEKANQLIFQVTSDKNKNKEHQIDFESLEQRTLVGLMVDHIQAPPPVTIFDDTWKMDSSVHELATSVHDFLQSEHVVPPLTPREHVTLQFDESVLRASDLYLSQALEHFHQVDHKSTSAILNVELDANREPSIDGYAIMTPLQLNHAQSIESVIKGVPTERDYLTHISNMAQSSLSVVPLEITESSISCVPDFDLRSIPQPKKNEYFDPSFLCGSSNEYNIEQFSMKPAPLTTNTSHMGNFSINTQEDSSSKESKKSKENKQTQPSTQTSTNKNESNAAEGLKINPKSDLFVVPSNKFFKAANFPYAYELWNKNIGLTFQLPNRLVGPLLGVQGGNLKKMTKEGATLQLQNHCSPKNLVFLGQQGAVHASLVAFENFLAKNQHLTIREFNHLLVVLDRQFLPKLEKELAVQIKIEKNAKEFIGISVTGTKLGLNSCHTKIKEYFGQFQEHRWDKLELEAYQAIKAFKKEHTTEISFRGGKNWHHGYFMIGITLKNKLPDLIIKVNQIIEKNQVLVYTTKNPIAKHILGPKGQTLKVLEQKSQTKVSLGVSNSVRIVGSASGNQTALTMIQFLEREHRNFRPQDPKQKEKWQQQFPALSASNTIRL